MPDLRLLAGFLAACVLVAPARAGAPLEDVLAPVAARPSRSVLPAGWQHGVLAEIYVRGYADSNGDGIGDLRGLTGKLDYLKALGVSGIWLMPVTRSGDHDHGYAVADYRDIEPAYGTLADFDEFVEQAHARGIGVIVDYVINHSARSHPLFQAAADDRDSPYRGWYLWQDQGPKGWKIFDKDPWNRTPTGYYFSQFSAGMPDWNLLEPAVMAWHMDNLRFWLNRGVDGFRFDAVAHLVEKGKVATRDLPESMALMREAVRVVHSYPNRYVVCEATREEKRWASDEGCGGAFAIWMAPNFARAATGDSGAAFELAKFFADAPAGMASMVSNHDLFAGERLWDQAGGEPVVQKLAAALYLLGPATPFVYYGEELGMSAAPNLANDPRVRVPMSWTARGFGGDKAFRSLAGNAGTQNFERERADKDSLLAWYRQVIAVRNATPALSRGHTDEVVAEDGPTWKLRRSLDGQVAVVLINFSGAPRHSTFRGLPASTTFRNALGAEAVAMASDAKGEATVLVPRNSALVFVAGEAR